MSPPLSNLVRVIDSDGFKGLVSRVSLPPGAVLTTIEGTTPASKPTWSSVQTSENTHVELNSDLVNTNHSCDPNVVYDMTKNEVRVVDDRGLREGDELTFFYPSTEWEMARPFDCKCGSKKCLGVVRGARLLTAEELGTRWLSPYIMRLIAKRQ